MEIEAFASGLNFSDVMKALGLYPGMQPGPVPRRDAAGKLMLGPDGAPRMTEAPVSPRWVGSGWTVFNKPMFMLSPHEAPDVAWAAHQNQFSHGARQCPQDHGVWTPSLDQDLML